MKTILLPIAAFFFTSCLLAQSISPVDKGSAVKFSIKNFGLNVSGDFKGLKGKINFNPANLPAANISVSVDAATVNTGNGSRDGHLKKDEYFDVAKYPLISFVSTKITNSNKTGVLFIEGKVTIKGVTKIVSFPFTATPKQSGYLFVGEFKINRRDFGVGRSSVVMSDKLTVALSVLAN